MANVMLFFLSNYAFKERVSYYKYESSVESATHTNMGPTRALMSYLQGDLDKIIYLASDTVREKGFDVRFKEELKDWAVSKSINCPDFRCPDWDSFFGEVQVSDDFRDDEIMCYVIAMVKEIQPQDHVYIDFSGGFRQAAFALLAVSKILLHKGVREIEVLTAHYNPGTEYSEERPLHITGNKSVSAGIDYVSATQYFLKTGDITELENWFMNNEGPLFEKEKDIIFKFKAFYSGIALCQVDSTLKKWQEILEALEAYQRMDAEVTSSFENIVSLFVSKMSTGSDEYVVSLLNWCLEHDLMQQALTIFNEKIPALMGFTKSKLLYEWPMEVPKKQKNSYLGIFTPLREAFINGCISEIQYNFKTKYLLLDSIRDHVNHASEEEKANGIDGFLAEIEERPITELLSDLSYVKTLIKDVLNNIDGYKSAFKNNT